MKYIFLEYCNQRRLNALSPSKLQRFKQACVVNNETLRQRGQLLTMERFSGCGDASTVRIHEGKVLFTDASIGDAAQPLTGFYVIDARDLNEAIRVAAQMPQSLRGIIEVRQIETA